MPITALVRSSEGQSHNEDRHNNIGYVGLNMKSLSAGILVNFTKCRMDRRKYIQTVAVIRNTE